MARRVVRRPPAKPEVKTVTCDCGMTSIEIYGPDRIVIVGYGWKRQYQWIHCGKCGWEWRYAPLVEWRGKMTGEVYPSRPPEEER